MAECAKCRKTKSDGLVGCEGPCGRWFHNSCIGMTDSDFKTVQRFKNLLYVCDTCHRKCQVLETTQINKFKDNIASIDNNVEALRRDLDKDSIVTFVKDQIDDFSKKMINTFSSFKENLQVMVESKVQDIQDVIKSSPESNPLREDRLSYSSILKNSSTRAIVVQPKNSSQTYAKTRSEILHNINPIETSLNVSRIKNIRNGGVIVGCTSKEETDKFKQLATDKLAGNYEIKELGSINPRIRISGLTDKYEPENLINFLKKQNQYIFSDDSSINVLHVGPIKKNKHVYQAKLSMDITSYKKLMQEGMVFVGYDCCPVYDAIELRMCYNCCGFSHLAKNCDKIVKCPKCSEDHKINDCNVSNSRLFQCVNCVSRSLPNSNHAAWDSQCPIFMEKLEKFKSDMFNIK